MRNNYIIFMAQIDMLKGEKTIYSVERGLKISISKVYIIGHHCPDDADTFARTVPDGIIIKRWMSPISVYVPDTLNDHDDRIV